MKNVIKKSWDCYIKDNIRDALPKYVICIGKGVANIVEHDLKVLMGNNYCVLPLPNAFLSSQEHMNTFSHYYEIYSKFTN